ncbi:MAG: protease pro-enzyme activation domain-containing protein, partial [Usitatibacter sp.]
MKALNSISHGFHARVGCVFAALFLAAHALAAEPVSAPGPDARTGDDGVGAGKRKLEGYRRPDFAKAPFVAPLDRDVVLHLAIGLPVRDRAAFDALVEGVSDPKSPDYRKFLTPEDVTARFGPTAEDYAALAAFVRGHGFKVVRTFDNRYVLDVSAPVATVERVLHVKMNQYRRPDGTLFFAPDRDPSIDYEGPILFISGLENYVLPKHHVTPYHGSGPVGLLNSADLRRIYADSNAALLGQGESVGLLELITPIVADIYGNGTPGTGYAGRAGLPSPLANASWPAGTSVAPLLMWPPGSTGSTLTSTTSPYDATSMEEAALDVEMAMAMAPALDSIVTYTASQIAATDFSGQLQNAALIDDALNAMISPPANYPRPRQISASLNWLSDPMTQQIVKTMALQHQSFFVSSGDLGAYQDQTQGANCAAWPVCYTVGPNTYCNDLGLTVATLVGGTLFSASPGAPYDESEVAWSPSGSLPGWPGLSSNTSSGGGVMNVPAPPYQAAFTTNGASATQRNSPDVAAAAGGLFFVFNNGGFSGGGTSASAPLWAGYTALVNQQRAALGLTPGIGFLNPTLYALATANYSANFHDVIVGDNSRPADPAHNLQACSGFNAGTGYDLVTGLGSPTGTLIANLAGTTLTAANEGEPHLSTVDGLHYDFQSAGEFVSLRDAGGNGHGVEIQTRQTPVTTVTPYTNPYTGLATCVSMNTAVAARVGNHRVTYQPNLSGIADPSGLQLRVDGTLATLPPNGIDLGNGARVISSAAAAGAIEVDFPGGTQMVVTPSWWGSYNLWYLNVDVFHTQASEGIMGARAAGSWLPALPNGGALGAMPAALPQRYTEIYQTFANAWRVSNATSLFDYAPGTSTASFTLLAWPPQNADCTLPDRKPIKPLPRSTAKRLCRGITDRNRNADCVFDTMAMGDAVFAKTYLASQRIEAGLSRISLRASTERSRPGQEVRFVARVAPSSASAGKRRPVPTGTVQFTVDGR